MHAFAAGTEFAGRLRPPQQQHADESGFAPVEIEDFLEAVLIFGDAAVKGIRGAGQTVFFEAADRLADGVFIETHEGIAIGFLVAGIDQGIQGKRIVIRSGDVLLDQRAEHSRFGFVQDNIHGSKSYCNCGAGAES